MNLSRENTEIREHEMWAEGTADNEPTEYEVIQHMHEFNWEVENVEIWRDHIQQFWRWNCDLKQK